MVFVALMKCYRPVCYSCIVEEKLANLAEVENMQYSLWFFPLSMLPAGVEVTSSISSEELNFGFKTAKLSGFNYFGED